MASFDAKFQWTLELDNQIVELVESYPCLYNKEDKFYKVPWKRNSSLQEIANIIGCDMFDAAKRFKQLKDRYLMDITDSQSDDKFVMCNMEFLQPHLDINSDFSSGFVLEFVNVESGSQEKRKVADEEELQAAKKKCLITTESTLWSTYGISLGQTLAGLEHNAACSLRHVIENIIFYEMND